MLGILKVAFPVWFTPVLWGLIGAGIVAVILASLVLVKRIPARSPEVTTANIETNIRNWLDAFQIGTKKVEDPQWLFAFVAELDNKIHVLIARPKNLDRYVILQSAITLSPEHKVIFDKLSESDKAIFAARLSIEISRAGVGYTMDLVHGLITLIRRVPITPNLNEGR